jgi:septum formation protein
MFWLCPPVALPPLVLASASPRRRELLERVGLSFQVAHADLDEEPRPGEGPAALVERLALEKGAAVARTVDEGVVLSADTVVVLDGRLLNKPRDAAEACRMLAGLAGRWHTVYTGFALQGRGRWETRPPLVGHETTRVAFHPLAPEQIEAYVATGEPLDKAGAYGIQDGGALLVRALEGDYFNVMGLPVARVGRELAAWPLPAFA